MRFSELVNQVSGDGLALKYNEHYIGLARGGVAGNFVTFPRPQGLRHRRVSGPAQRRCDSAD